MFSHFLTMLKERKLKEFYSKNNNFRYFPYERRNLRNKTEISEIAKRKIT